MASLENSATAVTIPAFDAVVNAPRDMLIEESRRRPSSTLARREWAVSFASAGLFVGVAVLMALAADRHAAHLSAFTAGLLVVTYSVVSRVEFEIGTGSAVPTELMLVPMLFILPPATVPLVVGAAYLGGALIDVGMGILRADRLPVVISTCWHAVGPALVLVVGGAGAPSWGNWPLYAAALGAQFAFDLISSVIREWLGFGISPAAVIGFMRPVFLVDALLAPAGLLFAFAVAPQPAAMLAVMPLVALIWVFSRERRARIDQALALTTAFDGVSQQARHDALTGLANRLGWEEALAAEQQRRARTGSPVGVIVIDADGLKQANDRYGHGFGDRVIQSLASTVSGCVRESDVVARIGGDEFALLLPSSGPGDTLRTVGRIADAVARQTVDGHPLSASIGHAVCPPARDLVSALKKADAAMYAAKRERSQRPAAGRDPR